MTKITRNTLLVCGLLLSVTVLMGLGLTSVQAAPSALPPRPTPVPTLPPTPALSSTIGGGSITLRVAAAPIDLWTTVEWQDAAGNWHLVDGWQGTLDDDQTKTWWVAKADQGKGPFRWVLYDRRGGQRWAISQPFTLPVTNRQNVEITITGPR
jgi:hypothetical protein